MEKISEIRAQLEDKIAMNMTDIITIADILEESIHRNKCNGALQNEMSLIRVILDLSKNTNEEINKAIDMTFNKNKELS